MRTNLMAAVLLTVLPFACGENAPVPTPKIGSSYRCTYGNDQITTCKPTNDTSSECRFEEQRGTVGSIDCGQAYDGPAYFIDMRSGRVLATCGGALRLHPENAEMCSFEAHMTSKATS